MTAVIAPASHGFDANGLRLVVDDWGGAGDPVLLAHATGFHGRAWAEVATGLVGAGRHVWSFDFRGHGDSDAPPVVGDAYAWSEFGDDAFAVAEHLGIAGDPALLACGHSKGAAALFLAEAKHPGTFGRIWAYEPIIFSGDASAAPRDDFPLSRSARKRRNEWSSINEAYDAYASKPPLNVMTPASLRAYVAYGLRDRGDGVFELKCRPEVEARVYAMAPNNGAWNVLPDVASDVLIVCGETSTDVGPSLAAQLAQRVPRGRMEILPKVGHFGPQQDPERSLTSVLQFLDISHPAG